MLHPDNLPDQLLSKKSFAMWSRCYISQVITNSNNIREFFLHPNGDHISGRKKAIEVMREEGGYEKKEFDKMIRKMKQVSDRNQNKPSQHQTSDGGWGPGGNSKDTEDDEWRGGSIDPG